MSDAIGTTEATDTDDADGAGDAGDAGGTAVGFLRHGADVLLVRRQDPSEDPTDGEANGGAAGDRDAGAWDAIRVVAGDDPGAAIRHAIEAAVGTSTPVEFVRRGEPFRPGAADAGGPVFPYLFEVAGDRDEGDVDADGRGVAASEWVQPTAALDRGTVTGLWTAWRRVAPTVGTVRSDADHGASYLSVRALEVLRDRAAALATGAGGDASADEESEDLPALAAALIDARPGMAVVATRIDRVMADAGEDPGAVRERAEAALAAAIAADEEAARAAAARLGELSAAPTVLTLSRSGTVRRALAAAAPAAVLVAESRPGGEGVGVAEALAGDANANAEAEATVTLFPDAAVAHVLGTRAVDAVLVGADGVLPDGTVVNKVGTRAAAAAAAREGVPVYAACSRDKVFPEAPSGGPELAPRDPAELYDGDAPIAVENPTFDATPADLVAGIATEEGVLDTGAVEAVAAELRALREWRRPRE